MLNMKRAVLAAAILLIAACSGDAGKLLGPSEGPAPDISDAAHAGAVPGFYFLPPMVSSPSFSGTFDPALSPRVEICALSGAACGSTVATFTMTSGSSSEVVQVSTTSQHYSVNWHTNQFSLDPTKTYRISVFVGTTLLGFADVDVVSSGREMKNVDTQQFIPLVDDRTLPIKFRIETGIVGQVVVSPAADTVNVGGTAQFTATLQDLHGNPVSGPTVTWSSSNTAVATIDAGGLATGVAQGTVTITASLGYVSGTASLTVEQPNQPPTSADDSFDAIGNVTVPVPAPGVLANDTDPDGHTLTATAGTFPTANGGTVVMNADGSFTYLSAPGFTGTDSFTYTATDGVATTTSTVTMTVPTRVWYVSNAGAAPGDGRDASPFTTLKAAESASAAGETIFLLAGNGSSAGYDEGIVLKTGQSLTGQGITSNVTATLNGQPVVLLAAGSTPTVTRSDAGATIQLATHNTVQGVHVASSNGAGIVGSNFGTFTAGSLSVSAQGGPALDLWIGQVAAAFGNVSSSNSAGAGLKLSNLSGTLSATGGSVSGAAGEGVAVTGGNADISYAGDIGGSGTRAVSVTGRTGGTVTLSGSISDASGGIVVANNTGGTIAFTGPAKALSTSMIGAVSLTSNTGASVVFAGGGLSIATTTGYGLVATGGGTLTITGANNTIGATAATALRVENTTIGASGLTFRSISAGAGNNGIVLVNTGSQNGLQVTGTGSPGSGGTIQNMGGPDGGTGGTGVYLSNARNVSLSYMQLSDFDNFAIRGFNVTGFSMTGTVVSGTNGNNATLDEGSVAFDQLTGAASIVNSTLSGGVEDNFRVVNTGGTLDRITFNGVTVGANGTADGDDGVELVALNSAVLKATVQNSVFTSARGHLLQLSLQNDATSDLVMAGNTFRNNHPAILPGAGGVAIDGTGSPTLAYEITGNTFRDAVGGALNVVKGAGAGSFSGRIENNVIGVSGVASSGSVQGSGLSLISVGGGVHTVAVSGNQVHQHNNQGILLQVGDAAAGGHGALNATVTGNTVANPGTAATIKNGIHLNAGTTTGDQHAVCLALSGNSITGSGSGGVAGTDFRLRQRFLTTVRLPGYAGANDDNAAVTAFVQANNGSTPTGLVQNAVSTGGGGYVGGAVCPQP